MRAAGGALRPSGLQARLARLGYFAVRLARAVPQGRVFAIDVEPDLVRYLAARAAKEGLANLQSVLGTAADPKLPSPVDLVFLCDAFHHLGDRQGYATRLRKRVRPGGRLAIVEYRPGELPGAPPEELRVSPEALTAELAAAGWERLSLDEATLPFQYVAIFGGP